MTAVQRAKVAALLRCAAALEFYERCLRIVPALGGDQARDGMGDRGARAAGVLLRVWRWNVSIDELAAAARV